MSGGLLRRLNIACGIAHKPKLIIFDEPTVAVDPQSHNNILEGIVELNKKGSTIIYTSHYMEEIEQICTRIVIMDKGKNLANGTADELKKLIKNNETIYIDVLNLNKEHINNIKQMNHIYSVTYDNNIFEATSLNIAVFDYDNSDLSHALYNYLDSTQNIVNIKDDNETICDELFNRNISYALFIREGFSSDFSLIENVKDTQSTSAYYLDNCISDYLKVLNSCLKAGYSNEEAISLTNSSINTTASMEIINNNTDDESLYFYFKYIPYAFVSVCLLLKEIYILLDVLLFFV